MADDKDSAPRARPFNPPLPPFRGAVAAVRAPVNSLTPPEAKRGSLFVGTRVPSKPALAPNVIDIAALAPEDATPPAADSRETVYVPSGTPAQAIAVQRAEPDSPRAEAIAATEAMPWLFADPGASQPVAVEADATPAERRDAFDVAPTPAANELTPVSSPAVLPRESDVAAVLESIASRVRTREIQLPPLEPSSDDATVLATVLAALLQQRAR